MTRKDPIAPHRISVEAAEWFATMQSAHVPARERAQFSQWISQSAEHVNEYLQIASTWRDLGKTTTPSAQIEELLAAVKSETVDRKVVTIDDRHRLAPAFASTPTRMPALEQSPRRWLWRAVATAAALALVALACVFAVDRWAHGRTYTTVVGEQVAFSLSDGSVVRLNTQSQLRVKMTRDARNVELVRGEALFEVAKDSSRPFRVQAGTMLVQAVGTAFNVYRSDDDATVTVIEGKVIVVRSETASSAAGTSVAHVELKAHEQARLENGGGLVKIANVSLEPVTAWKDRRLVFEGASLAEITDEFNRYNREKLRIDDADLASMRISAVFGATDPASLVEFLERTERVAVRRDDDGASVLHRAP